MMSDLSLDEKGFVCWKCREVVVLLRTLPIWVIEYGPHNILYCRKSRKLTIMDFESVGICEEDNDMDVEAPELLSIFGDDEHGLRAAGG